MTRSRGIPAHIGVELGRLRRLETAVLAFNSAPTGSERENIARLAMGRCIHEAMVQRRPAPKQVPGLPPDDLADLLVRVLGLDELEAMLAAKKATTPTPAAPETPEAA